MATKKPAAKAAKAKPAAKTATKAKAKPKGLQLQAYQVKTYNQAYNAASNAAYRKLILQAQARGFRKNRLGAAHGMMKQYAVAYRNARAAAVANYATKQSYRQSVVARQNSALRARIRQDYARHSTLLGRAQFAQAGEKKWLHTSIMRTVNQQQALSHEAKVMAAAARAAKAAAKAGKKKKKFKKGKKQKSSITAAQRKQIAATSRRAGLRAVHHMTKQQIAHAKAVTAKAQKQAQAKAKAKAAAQSKKATVKKAKGRAAPMFMRPSLHPEHSYWIPGGNDTQPTCVMTAVANALFDQTGWRLPDEDILYWTRRMRTDSPSVEQVLKVLYRLQPWPQVKMLEPFLTDMYTLPYLIVGYETEHGPHAAYAFGTDSVVSWGELEPWPANVEEAWSCRFIARSL